MSANTETTGADRTKCKAWCGTARTGSEGTWSLTADLDEVAIRWCSQHCTDARLPPIAAPAAHVERRKEQVWRHTNSYGEITEWILTERHADGWECLNAKGASGFLQDTCWSKGMMTLLADAPPEPAKSEACRSPQKWQATCDLGGPLGHCNHVACAIERDQKAAAVRQGLCCSEHVTSGGAAHHTTCSKYIRQEAPKAAPVCSFAPPPGNLHAGAVLKRTFVTRNDVGKEVSQRFACDSCYTFEEEMTFGLGGPSVLNDSRHPTRLPRPRPPLAADWVWDCIGDVR